MQNVRLVLMGGSHGVRVRKQVQKLSDAGSRLQHGGHLGESSSAALPCVEAGSAAK